MIEYMTGVVIRFHYPGGESEARNYLHRILAMLDPEEFVERPLTANQYDQWRELWNADEETGDYRR